MPLLEPGTTYFSLAVGSHKSGRGNELLTCLTAEKVSGRQTMELASALGFDKPDSVEGYKRLAGFTEK